MSNFKQSICLRSVSLTVGALGFLFMAMPTQAANVPFNFSGSVAEVHGGVFTSGGSGANGFGSALPVSGSFTFNSTTPDVLPGDPMWGLYANPILNMTVKVGNYTATFTPGSSVMQVITNPGLGDTFKVTLNGFTSSPAAGKEYAGQLSSLKKKQKQLNELPVVDYEIVMKFKLSVLKELYAVMGADCFEKEDYKKFYADNKHWLEPYAAFSYFRDKYHTSHFNEWKTNGTYNRGEIDKLLNGKSPAAEQISLYCFIQYHLHLQLKETVDYAHKKGIVIKGDIPIGIYRYGCDAWVAPELYNLEWQAGAPPDDFAAVGQNWGFPTYNWKRMQENGFSWWKQRFEQMSKYFDAFRIDHIFGFFRIL